MSAVDLIVTALAAGATAGMKDTVSTAIRDAYNELKHLLNARWVDHEDARRALEADETEPGAWQARVGDALVNSGAAIDAQVVAVAERLLALADPAKAESFHVKVDTNYGAIGSFSAPVTFNQGPPVPPTAPAAQ